jgi:hypothetical protein
MLHEMFIRYCQPLHCTFQPVVLGFEHGHDCSGLEVGDRWVWTCHLYPLLPDSLHLIHTLQDCAAAAAVNRSLVMYNPCCCQSCDRVSGAFAGAHCSHSKSAATAGYMGPTETQRAAQTRSELPKQAASCPNKEQIVSASGQELADGAVAW